MDWSYAGYMYGDNNVPTLPAMADMKDTFGAVGDGVTDDTAAFDLALTTIEAEGTLYLPPGTYVITRVGSCGRGGGQVASRGMCCMCCGCQGVWWMQGAPDPAA
jgi:hypothetical protein